MNYLDLFHGIGGFALGAYWAGMKFDNHLCSDIEPYCQKLYKLRFPGSIQLDDITKIDSQELIKTYGTEWIITGGFPCQDISIAGKGAGITGSRSGLWFEYWRLIRDLRPQFAIMENVSALTFRGLDVVLGTLSEIGYNAEWQIIRASDMGAPHKRERVWIATYPFDSTDAADRGQTKKKDSISRKYRKTGLSRMSGGTSGSEEILADANDDGCLFGQNEIKPANRRESAQCDISAESEEISDASITGLERQKSEGRTREHNGLFTECNRGDYWSVEPAIRGIFNELSERLDRLKK